MWLSIKKNILADCIPNYGVRAVQGLFDHLKKLPYNNKYNHENHKQRCLMAPMNAMDVMSTKQTKLQLLVVISYRKF